ncbi:MAG: hypothetical protein ACOCXT_01445 [Candidatus Dojkabacteria bacterium]
MLFCTEKYGAIPQLDVDAVSGAMSYLKNGSFVDFFLHFVEGEDKKLIFIISLEDEVMRSGLRNGWGGYEGRIEKRL